MADFKFQKIPPPEPLREHILCFWILENRDADFRPKKFKLLVDGVPGLVFQEAADSFSDSMGRPFPRVFLHGLGTGHSEKTARKMFRNIKVEFQPTGLRTLFVLDACPLRRIHSALNRSERSLERLFNLHVGIPPKSFGNIVRFQRALRFFRNQAGFKSADVAVRTDYADQSHFIREFKRFTGMAPRQFKRQASEHVENFPEFQP